MKGQKTGGRQAGTPNQITANIRQAISEALIDEAKNVGTLFESLPPKERLLAFTKLAALIVPTEDARTENLFGPIQIAVKINDEGPPIATCESEIVD